MGFQTLLEKLAAAEVRFVVVGGVGAVLQGVPTNTFDLDIVHARDAQNRSRLETLLESLDLCYRQHLPKRLTPQSSEFDCDEHMLLMTRDAPLDVLGAVVGGRRYEDLLPRSHAVPLRSGAVVHVLGLDALIEHKEELGREKDLAHLPLLKRTLEERRTSEE